MLYIFTQANASRVWADWDAELGGHKEDRQDFVYPADTAGVDLADGNGVGLKKLLEDDAILHMLTGGNTYRRDYTRNGGMPENIIGAGGFFNPEGVKCSQVLHGRDRLVHLPHLVCIEHQAALCPNLFAHDTRTVHIVRQAQADLQFEVPPAVSQRIAAKQAHLFIAIARPTRTGCIRRKAMLYHLRLAPRLGRSLAAQQVERIIRSQDITDIAEIDTGDNLLWLHIGKQLPQRLPLDFGPQIPDRVHHSSGRQVDNTLLRPDPAQLAITSDRAPERTHVRGKRLQGMSDDQGSQCPNGRDANLVPTSDGKGQTMPFQTHNVVCSQNHVGSGIIRGAIHGI